MLRFAIDDLYGGVTAEKLGRYALLVLGIAALAGLLRFGMRHWVIGISRRLEFDLRNELFAHLQRMPTQWFVPSSSLVRRASPSVALRSKR